MTILQELTFSLINQVYVFNFLQTAEKLETNYFLNEIKI